MSHPPSETTARCRVIMRFTANLERLDSKGEPYLADSSDCEENDDNDEDIEQAKATDTYGMFRSDILRGARPKHVRWTLTKILPDGQRQVVPNSCYLTRMARYEDDLELSNYDGEIQTMDRIVPDGFNAGLYCQEDPLGTKFQFQLKGKQPFLIRNFRMDTFSASPAV